MDTFNPLTLSRYNTSCLTIMKERTPLNQLMAFKDSNVQRVIQLVHRVVQKSCRRACQLFCCPLDTMLCEKACPAQNQQITEDKTTQVAVRSLPSTILIVNISNSTLIDCVIGHESYPSAVAEGQPLMQGSGLHMYDQMTCSYSQGQQGAAQTSASPPPPLCPPLPPEQPPSINIHSSHLNFVIIGDNNYMHAEQICSNELEEPQV
ncbi:uncharacterized protein LOC121186669 [Toxotes jaculatrix]|uniref:uncharacterized protein LOC121186669 n=1 Tax=Toxotes jaculatrix TaxID=941984 RepID=UPI001B3A9C6E|nr:uncharacterized protein LOC121186669 [Toxotes jaculatrix]